MRRRRARGTRHTRGRLRAKGATRSGSVIEARWRKMPPMALCALRIKQSKANKASKPVEDPDPNCPQVKKRSYDYQVDRKRPEKAVRLIRIGGDPS